MPAFLVHGVPDTSMLWDDVRAILRRKDVIAPSLPGFSTPVPDGFDDTKDAYVNWLIARVEEVGEPVDIVGHDWGSLLVQRLVSLRPDLVRTWAAGGGPLDTEYVWHDTAKIWQTPGAGEQLMQAFTPDAMTGALSSQGLEESYARAVSEKIDDTMKTCILALYRSATKVAEDWPPLKAPCPPGLVLWGADDPYCPVDFGQRLAERTDAKYAPFDGCGHWWPHQRAAEVAALLNEHWS
ncbi:MAG: alpha/beta hydrolase [Chloroflexi bacterium]|nr:alpha/beta hydrolase [Chloroflexota bacterium]